MTRVPQNNEEEVLGRILREARPAPALPSGFQKAVWRRIECEETSPNSLLNWLDSLAERLMRPRMAVAGIATMVLIGVAIGLLDGVQTYKSTVKERYVVAVTHSSHN